MTSINFAVVASGFLEDKLAKMAACACYSDDCDGSNDCGGMAGQQPTGSDEQLAECASECPTTICPSTCASLHKQHSCDEHVQEWHVRPTLLQ